MTITTTTTSSINTITHLAKPSLSASSKDKISKLFSSWRHSNASSIFGTVNTLHFVYLQPRHAVHDAHDARSDALVAASGHHSVFGFERRVSSSAELIAAAEGEMRLHREKM